MKLKIIKLSNQEIFKLKKFLPFRPFALLPFYLFALLPFYLFTLLPLTTFAQHPDAMVDEDIKNYVYPTDKLVLEKLHQWQDLKFGVIFHWGLYAEPGIVESWSICSEDVDWISRNKDLAYEDYKKWYWGLSESFNPTHFNPDKWAEIMQQAGMKYLVFTSKHHDGFCMFDSKFTDFSIAKGPFKNNPKKDVLKHVFDSFRQKDFMIGCYFSKPDWHCPYFWNPYFATGDRNYNYKKENHLDWWENYQKYTENQMNELLTNYGKIDIFWLDGGWVKGDEVNLDRVLEKARATSQPGILSVDRCIGGKNENYITPERGVPAVQLPIPWESCITLSHDWGWVPNAPYKSPQTIINLLIEITAKGGSLLLGIGPCADGTIEEPVVQRLNEIGNWLKIYGKAIYNTKITSNYNDNNIWFTADKNEKTLYVIYAHQENETFPQTISWKGNLPIGKIYLLNSSKPLKYKIENGEVTVTLPSGMKAESFALELIIK